jgi:hypothetical protein
MASLARRGRARWVQPVAICYDHLAGPRPSVYVSVAPAIEPTPGRLTDEVAVALRRATPLTAGQVVAWQLIRGAASLPEIEVAVADWIERARAGERPIEPALLGPARRAFVAGARRRALRVGPSDPLIGRLAAELEDANSR